MWFIRASLLCAICTLSVTVVAVPRSTAEGSASTFAGATVSAVFPPPNATDTAVDTFFPDAAQVGHAGPTPTGDEAWAIQTAPVAPLKEDIYPLVAPSEEQAPLDEAAHTLGFDPARYWGTLSPWWSVGGAFGLPDTSPVVPAGCELTQVHLLHRHGARYPTAGSSPSQFAAKVHAAATSEGGFNASGPLAFLNTWTYDLGAEILTPFGREQLFDLGVAFRVKYGHLLKGFTDTLPVFRTTSNARMVDSSLHFAAGFFGVQQYQSSYHQLIVIEDDGFIDSLDPWDACPNVNADFTNLGIDALTNWTQVFLNDTVPRLQQFISGVELDPLTVLGMQQLCAYETVALGYSAFCDLFTEEEWRGYEYAIDLELWYSFGPGSPISASLGSGYAQELVARLTQTPISDFNMTTLNQTLDESNITFPLNQPIYVDATHDTVISMILVALNLTSAMTAAGPLPVDHIQENQTYVGSQIVPFAANLVGQVMSCPSRAEVAGNKSGSFIRFLLNDGVVPLTGITHCTEDKDGLCAVEDFVSGMKERIAEIDFAYDCFANYTVPWPDPIVDGRMAH